METANDLAALLDRLFERYRADHLAPPLADEP